jgi:hypothetical protein
VSPRDWKERIQDILDAISAVFFICFPFVIPFASKRSIKLS